MGSLDAQKTLRLFTCGNIYYNVTESRPVIMEGRKYQYFIVQPHVYDSELNVFVRNGGTEQKFWLCGEHAPKAMPCKLVGKDKHFFITPLHPENWTKANLLLKLAKKLRSIF